MKCLVFILSVLLATAVTCVAQLSAIHVVVAPDGSGDFSSVQQAIDAAPSMSTQPHIIFIRNGQYVEKINIPPDKPFIQLLGESTAHTLITYHDYSGAVTPTGTITTSTSATLTVQANDVLLQNLTIENSTGDAPQAVALAVYGTRVVVRDCRLAGGQDTLLAHGNGAWQYYDQCFIEGVVDFIFGNARAWFEHCTITARDRKNGNPLGYITAANTSSDQRVGFVFHDCYFPSNAGVTRYVLGRPWQNSSRATVKSFPKVVVMQSVFGANLILPEGWMTWDAGTDTTQIEYAEYKNRLEDGSRVDTSHRVTWSHQLTEEEAARFTVSAVFPGWDPRRIYSNTR